MGNGTPILAQINGFTATASIGGGTCTFNITVLSTPPCGNPITDSRDGRVYQTVLIGTQCWMAQNMNAGTMINGSAEQTNNGVIEKYCSNNDEANCNVYGGLYQWAEMVQYLNGITNTTSWNPFPSGDIVGICPTGWHIPSDVEWTTLTSFLGGESVAGGKMKEIGTIHWLSPNTGATNSSGFTGLAGGYRASNGTFTTFLLSSFFWASSQYDDDVNYAWYRKLGSTQIYVSRNVLFKTSGFSVRCLKY